MYRGGNLSHMIQGWRFLKLGWHSYDTEGEFSSDLYRAC